MRFYWVSSPVISFAQGAAATVNLSQYVTNPLGKSLTYSVASGALPTGCTLSGYTVSYNGTAGVSSSSVAFTVTDGAQLSRSATITAQVITAADTQAPTVPAISFTGVTSSSITVNWTAATDNVGVAGYTLQRSTDNATWTTLYDGAARTYTDSGRSASTLYYYRVRSYDAAGNQSAYGLGQTSTSAAGWGTVPDFTFTLGTASSQSFGSYIPAGESFDSITPSLPAGLSVSGNEIVYDGTTGAGNYGPYVLSSVAASGSLPVLALSGGGVGKPWTFGHAFKKGDVPAGYYITAGGPSSFQADVRNRWDDGSVKFAVLSGIGGTSAVLSATLGTAPTGEVALVDPQASVTFTGDVTGTYSCPTSDTVTAWDKATAHLVRKISGPVMTERHYYVPTTDAHVAVWFYVRSYLGGATEVETVIENGWFQVADPADKTYGVTVTVGGSEKYSDTISHLHHAAWSRVDWVGTDPEILPVHDKAYLLSTYLVPNYTTSGVLEEAAFAANTDNGGVAVDATYAEVQGPTPFSLGKWPSFRISAAGETAGGWNGILPHWEALACVSDDLRAYRCTIATARRMSSRFQFLFRDEVSGLYPPPSKSANAWTGGGPNPIPLAGLDLGNFSGVNSLAETHAPAVGFLSYLLTGRWHFLDQGMAANSLWNFKISYATHWPIGGGTTRNGTDGYFSWADVRSVAWRLRTMAQTVCTIPDSDTTTSALKTEWRQVFERNLKLFLDFQTGDTYGNTQHSNNLGMLFGVNHFTNPPDGDTTRLISGPWYQNYVITALGYTYWLEITSEAGKGYHEALLSHSFRLPIGLMGLRSSGFSYRRGNVYAMTFGTSDTSVRVNSLYLMADGGWIPDWQTMYSTNLALYGGEDVDDISTTWMYTANWDGRLWVDTATVPTSYTYAQRAGMALAFAVDYGQPGAAEALARFNSSETSINAQQARRNFPRYAIVPR